MTTIYQQINQDYIESRKNKNPLVSALLSTLINDIQQSILKGLSISRYGILKPTEDDCVFVIKQYIKNTNATLKLKDNETSRKELEVLESYLPKHLPEEEVLSNVNISLEEGKALGKKGGALLGHVNQYFKAKFPNRYDAKKLRELVEKSNV